MAKRVMFEMIDDLDGSVYADGAGETIHFGVDGVDYAIDLKVKNAKQFRSSLERFVEHSTRVGKSTRTAPASKTGAAKRDPEQLSVIRRWASDNGFEVSDRGRIPAAVEKAFAAAH